MTATVPAVSSARFTRRFMVPVLLGPTLNPINSTMIAVALVPIATALDITAARTIWLVAVLYLAAAISQPTMGPWTICSDRRRST
ncbi:hypothetical protein ABZ599_39950 [Streptomyces misionensis]|uniref:hypothetical protein n=1 Tax=Streptomyces misionensis TaxID=67331 RepID=UPI0033F34BFA